MIVVTGATGQIGRHLVRNLLTAKAPLRLIVRDPAKLPADVRGQVEVVQGSHGNASVVEKAFQGAEAVFWLVPPDPGYTVDQVFLDFTRPAAEVFSRLGVKRVVGVTALGHGTRWQDNAGLVTASIRMDEMIMQSGVAYRGLAMPSFMDNVLRQAGTLQTEGVLSGQMGPDRRMPTTATRDLATVAAQRLIDGSWDGQEIIPLLGPENLSSNEMAAVLSEVIGRTIRYRQTSLEELKAQVLARGGSESFAQGYVDMMCAKNEGMDNVAHRTEQSRTPTTFREWCQQELLPVLQR